jgi:N-succinyldiaminopimelate aminotransferase
MAGATRRVVTLKGPTWTFSREDLRAAITPRTRALVLNSPHNPSGKIFTPDELADIASACVEHDLIAITDEVYEHLVFQGSHQPLATFPGMSERTVQISSGAKTFSFTGWKVGWACASAPLIAALRTTKQFLTYVNAAPFQHAIAAGLNAGARLTDAVAPALLPQRDLLSAGLTSLGFCVLPSSGTFFLTTDLTPLGESDGARFCWSLPERCGVAAIPTSVFYDDPKHISPVIRWTFCKRLAVLHEALERLAKLLG